VLNAAAPSTWRYVTVDRSSPVARDGWTLTGGITFYQSAIRLDHCRIINALGEDGINVVRAQFQFVNSEFGPTVSDAFDGDFAWGTVERCVFHNVDADGIDVSGSQVEVSDVRFINIGDKGLSVGEGSQLTARNIYVENADFGAASKDRSHLTLSNATIVGARVAGLAAYIKKPSYGPASITAEAVAFVDVPADRALLVEVGSWIDLDGVRTYGVDVDVEALYEKWTE